MAGGVVEGGEGLLADPVDEGGGVVGGVRRHGQHAAVAGVDHHRRAGGGDEALGRLVVVGGLGRGDGLGQGLLGHLLQVEVEGEAHVVALHRRLLAQRAQDPALGVDLQLLHLGLAPEVVLVGQLHARLPDRVPGPVSLALAGRQLLVVDLPHVAEDVGREARVRVEALGQHHPLHARVLGLVLPDVDERLLGDVVGHRNGLERAVPGVVDALLEDGHRDLDEGGQVGDHVVGLLAQLGLVDGDGGHDPVADQDLAVAVEDPAPGGLGVDEAHAVELGFFLVGGGGQDLQVPQAGQQGAEQGDHDHAQDPHAQAGGVAAHSHSARDRRPRPSAIGAWSSPMAQVTARRTGTARMALPTATTLTMVNRRRLIMGSPSMAPTKA